MSSSKGTHILSIVELYSTLDSTSSPAAALTAKMQRHQPQVPALQVTIWTRMCLSFTTLICYRMQRFSTSSFFSVLLLPKKMAVVFVIKENCYQRKWLLPKKMATQHWRLDHVLLLLFLFLILCFFAGMGTSPQCTLPVCGIDTQPTKRRASAIPSKKC